MMKKRYDEVLLVAGTAVFYGEEKVRKALMYWQGFANQKAEDVPMPPGKLSPQVIASWAEEVFKASFKGEPDWVPPPKARVATINKISISLIWEGTFTKGRFVEVIFNDGDEPSVFLKWKTGTGKRSRFLSVEKALDFADFYESAVDSNNNVARSHWKECVIQTHWATLSGLI